MNRKIILKAAFVGIALILVLVILYSGLRILESTVFYAGQEEEAVVTKTIEKDGVKYYPRQDICVVMVLGVDQKGKVEASKEANHGGAVDMITLMVFDEKSQSSTLLCLNRDTMLEMPMLNEYGRETGTYYGQLAFSHTYGRGVEDSCVNTKKTVSRFLGVNINYYFAMNIDAIRILNDAVGGVTVTVTDDFSKLDPTIQKGKMTLNGEQALTFVQSRQGVSDQLNLSRIERQKEYMEGFVDAVRAKLDQESNFAIRAYEEAADYVVTDCSVAVTGRLMEDYGDYTLTDVISLEGENVRGESYYEFHADQASLEALVLKLFYAPK